MRIYEYDEVNPNQVLHLNLLCLNFALTPERVAVIRRMDPRPFPFLALYAMAGGIVAGQVGVFRLPVVATSGAAEVGGVWAVSTHPAHANRGIATALLGEAHRRMREAGLRFSTLGTSRSGVAHGLYRKMGYEDVHASASVLIRSTALPRRTPLRAERAGIEGLDLADRLFEAAARPYLGFARRHKPFFAFLHERSYLDATNLWILTRDGEPVGYAAATTAGGMLTIHNLLVPDAIDPLAAVAALARENDAPHLHVQLERASEIARFARAGFRPSRSVWSTFMVKPLADDATVDEFRRLFGLDSGRFLKSYMDVT